MPPPNLTRWPSKRVLCAPDPSGLTRSPLWGLPPAIVQAIVEDLLGIIQGMTAENGLMPVRLV